MPSRSCRPRASSISSVSAQADEPNRLLPKRAPSSSAQSTSRTVTGGMPSYSSASRRRISTPASVFKQPSSQPPFGTESMCPPMRSALSEVPCRVAQKFPAASLCVSTGRSDNFSLRKARALVQVGVKATRCAPFSSPVSARNSFNSATVLDGFMVVKIKESFACTQKIPCGSVDWSCESSNMNIAI